MDSLSNSLSSKSVYLSAEFTISNKINSKAQNFGVFLKTVSKTAIDSWRRQPGISDLSRFAVGGRK